MKFCPTYTYSLSHPILSDPYQHILADGPLKSFPRHLNYINNYVYKFFDHFEQNYEKQFFLTLSNLRVLTSSRPKKRLLILE